MDELVFSIENIVRECGKKITNADRNNISIEEKEGIFNIVTNYDKEIQFILKSKLLELVPNSKFIGEEEFNNNIIDDGYVFIVDPIDGTTNFYRKFSLSTISVGLLKNKKPYIGVCYNPYTDEMFVAKEGKGAYLNNKKINVSNRKLKEGIVLTGSAPYYSDMRKESLSILEKFALNATDFRRFGSAVYELCNIASGRAEVYFELRLQPWDYAAGMLIVSEAGGTITDIKGNPIQFDKPTSVLATNNKEDYLKYIN